MTEDHTLWDLQPLKLSAESIDYQDLLLFAMRAIALSMAVPPDLLTVHHIHGYGWHSFDKEPEHDQKIDPLLRP